MKYRVCHITTIHPPFDSRIFHKECKSLARMNYEVFLIVCGYQSECKDGVSIVSVNSSKGLFGRLVLNNIRLMKKAFSLRARIYHFHDPEFIPFALVLKFFGKKVIYDIHEDVPRHILVKNYFPYLFRKLISPLFEVLERVAVGLFDHSFTVVPQIRDRFNEKKVTLLRNYPDLSEASIESGFTQSKAISKNNAIYVGNISEARCINEMIHAVSMTKKNDLKLTLIGKFFSKNLQYELQSSDEWKKVDYLGWIDHENVTAYIDKALFGFVMYQPFQNYIDCLPIKLFEYMARGIPVIASDYPNIRQVVSDSKCGILVDSQNLEDVVDAINTLIDNPKLALEMGLSGKEFVVKKYNWNLEVKILNNIYLKLLK